MQVHVVDVIQAIAQVMHKHRPSGGGRKAADGPRKNFDWPNVHAVLTEKFGVNSVDERCLRLPRGLGHSIVMCVNSWKDEQQQSRQQMMQECRM
jgi:hypothetical protein